jgi:hypothetical protein
MRWPFKKKLTREEIVNTISDLQNQLNEKENQMDGLEYERQKVFEQGKNTQDRQKRLFYAKKIQFIDAEKDNLVKEQMMIMYNVNLANRLKSAVDSDQFFGNVSGSKLNKILGNQKELGKFLNKAMNRRIKTEDMMTNADTVFNEVQSSYTTNEKIYGINEQDDKLLAIFEQDDLHQMESDQMFEELEAETQEKVGR